MKERGNMKTKFQRMNKMETPLENEERKKTFEEGKQILYFTTLMSENESIKLDSFEVNNGTLKLYLKNHTFCGVFPPQEVTYEFKIDSKRNNFFRFCNHIKDHFLEL